MERMSDAATVRDQYRTEERLESRMSVWRPSADGRNPQDLAAAAVRDARPTSILEIGCGTGAFAERLAGELPGASVLATDQSERFVELTVSRGVSAEVADVQQLPFGDASFDVVVAMWMLYHVTDLHRGLSEIRRVLRSGGTFVAVTNGEGHLADLLEGAGGDPLVTQFSSENGRAALRGFFDEVSQEDIPSRAVFPDHSAAAAYLATFDESLSTALPEFSGPREYAGATSVFVAR